MSPRRAGVALVLVALACGGARGPRVELPDAGVGDCRAGTPQGADRAPPATAPDTVRVAAPGPLVGTDPTDPDSYAERVAYRHLYGTLVTVDCRGRIDPALASAWERDVTGQQFTFDLRPARVGPGEAGGDGWPARAVDVVLNAWRRSGLLSDGEREARAPGSRPVYAARTGERRLSVSVPHAASGPALFADQRFAITGLVSAHGLPTATGSHRLRSVSRAPDAPTWLLTPRDEARSPVLRITGHRSARTGPGPSARDLLDRGVDLVVTRRSAPRRYAASLPAYGAEPLPWDRTYLLVVPELARRAEGAGGGPDVRDDAGDDEAGGEAAPGRADRPAAVLRDLARDAVRADARPARTPYWWREGCGAGRDASPGRRSPAAGDGRPETPAPVREGRDRPGRPPRLAYPADDPAAADVATRLAALSRRGRTAGEAGPLAPGLRAARGGADRLRAEPAPPAQLDSLLRDGDAAAYVLPLPRRVLAPCRARAELVDRAGWLGSALSSDGVVPLVDVRPHLLLRRGVGGVRIDWDGVPRLERARAGRPAEAP